MTISNPFNLPMLFRWSDAKTVCIGVIPTIVKDLS